MEFPVGELLENLDGAEATDSDGSCLGGLRLHVSAVFATGYGWRVESERRTRTFPLTAWPRAGRMAG